MPGEDVVRLSNGKLVDPVSVTILESGWVLCRFDRMMVRYPPRRVDRVETLYEGREPEEVESDDE